MVQHSKISDDTAPLSNHHTQDTSHSATTMTGIPVAAMVESIVGCKWSLRLLRLLTDGQNRPSALLQACPGLSTKVMNERLRKMLHFGILQRTVNGEKPPIEVIYTLKPFGSGFTRILDEVQRLQQAVDNGHVNVNGNIN